MTAKPLTPEESDPAHYGQDLPQPHPDGKPWDKCCTSIIDSPSGCQCLMKRPQFAGKSRFTEIMAGGFGGSNQGKKALQSVIDTKGRFFCVHRKTDDGFHRECAGWAAKFGHK